MAAKTWTQTSGNLWSTGANWNGGTVPATVDTVTFDVTSVANCTIDNLGTWSGGTFTIASTYSGVITQNSGINITTAAYSQAAGTFTGNAAATFTSTTFAMTAGTFNQGGAFVSTTFTVNTGSPSFQGASATMSTTAVTFGNSGTIRGTSGIWTLAGSWTQSGAATTYTHNSGTINITAACTFNDTRSAFNKINVTAGSVTVTCSTNTTWPLGATPSTSCSGTLTISGTATWTGTWTHTGGASGSSFSLFGGTLTGSTTPGIKFINGSYQYTSGTITNTLDIEHNITSTSNRTHTPASGATYGVFKRTGNGTGALTMSMSGPLTVNTLQDNDGLSSHSWLFLMSGAQITLTTLAISGAAGKIVTMMATVPNVPWTLTTSAGAKTVSYVAIQDSTVDASPTWTADSNSTNLGGNTNWIFTPASSGGGSSTGAHQSDVRRYRKHII